MKKIQRAWIVLSAISLLVFAIALIAYGALSYLMGKLILPEQYPNLNNIVQIFTLDFGFLSTGFLSFLTGFESIVFFGASALILILMSMIAFSKFKGKQAKYALSLTIGVLVAVSVTAWLLLNLSTAYQSDILAYVATGSLPVLAFLFAVFSLLSKPKHADAVEQTDGQQAEQKPQEPPVDIENTYAEEQALLNLQNIAATTSTATVENTDTPKTPKAEQQPKPVEQPKPVPEPFIYKAREPETISEIVARTYGEPKKISDENKRKKLQKIREMYEVGAITLYEYQQLTIRIMSEK